MMKKEKLLRALEAQRQKTERLFAELENETAAVLAKKPGENSWSALQTMVHLILAEETSLRYLKKKMSFEANFREAGLGEWFRHLLLLGYLNTPFKFKAPAVVSVEELPNDADLPTLKNRWMKNFDDFRDFFNSLPDEMLGKAIYRHPAAGRQSFGQMIRFFSVHFDRHRQQIKNALFKAKMN